MATTQEPSQDTPPLQNPTLLSAVAIEPHRRHRRSSSASSPSSSFTSPPQTYLGSDQPFRPSLDYLPPYSATPDLQSSALPPTEAQLFQIQELALPVTGSGLLSSQPQFICANPMHDQQYLLLGSGNALHSIDLTLPADRQSLRTHIQGVSFKEIHCLEEIGLVVVIAGRNSRVRCYDYDAVKRLVGYGHSKEGQGRVVECKRLGQVKNMIRTPTRGPLIVTDLDNRRPWLEHD
ncbi:hypothetical protein BGW38_001989 [Lunasporangiospora selenospora]|uniref:Uncharacterized protein n=1 Tax=Lunasporangiospora selenospora TaxID=979761 RepID=A0A9P6FSP3_9FUNG|nr:hypothetical protein BGW38_001989 [Lunasporangiospora selenospora]